MLIGERSGFGDLGAKGLGDRIQKQWSRLTPKCICLTRKLILSGFWSVDMSLHDVVIEIQALTAGFSNPALGLSLRLEDSGVAQAFTLRGSASKSRSRAPP